MNFPTDPLDVRLAFAFGVSLTAAPTSWRWTDCTNDLRTSSDQSVDVKVGRGDRAKQGEPNQATFSLNNFAGQYTVDNPAGVFFPNIVENVPGIIAVGRNANPTFEVDASDWSVQGGSVARSTVRARIGAGSLLLTPTGGVTAQTFINGHILVRSGGYVYVDAWVYSVAGYSSCRTDVDWYDGSNTYLSTTTGTALVIPAGVWTYLGSYLGPAPATAVSCAGRVAMTGTPANTDLLWIDEARTSIPELCGYVDGWTPVFDDSGNLATCAVSMSGVRRRLGRGQPPLKSALYRSMAVSAPTAWWHLEDGAKANAGGSGLPGGVSTNPIVLPAKFGAATIGDSGAASGVDFSAGGSLTAPTGQAVVAAPNGWEIECVGAFSALPTVAPSALVSIVHAKSSGVAAVMGIGITNNAGVLYWAEYIFDAGGSGSFAALTGLGAIVPGRTYHLRGVAQQIGAALRWTVYVDGVSFFAAGFNATVMMPDQVQVNVSYDPSAPANLANPNFVASLAFRTPFLGSSPTQPATNGYAGELAATRFARLNTEESVPAAAVLNGAKSIAMGSQPPQAFLDLLQEIETADGGIFYEPFDAFGFGYIVRADLYNMPVALTIDRAGGQLAPPFVPVHDDLQRQNYVTVARAGGSSATYIGDISRGIYKDGPTVSVATDAVLLNLAAWRAHLGSPLSRLRWPSVSINFANLQAAPLGPIFGATRGVGIRVQVINPPSQVPLGVDILVSGYTKTLAYKAWKVSLLGSPYEVWRVFTIGDPVLGRLDAGASTLTGGPYSAGAVSLSVATSTGPLWITTAGQPTKFPFDADIAGQRVTVTGISGVASPQTFTVAATPAALSNGAPVKLWRPACLAL